MIGTIVELSVTGLDMCMKSMKKELMKCLNFDEESFNYLYFLRKGFSLKHEKHEVCDESSFVVCQGELFNERDVKGVAMEEGA